MEYDKRIDSKSGNYIVTDSIDFEDILIKEPIEVGNSTINPNTYTDLFGWFTEPVLYKGILKEDGCTIKQAVFYLGKGNHNLFDNGGYYYDVTIILKKDRIGKSYKSGTFRDCYLRKKNGDIFWK